MTKRSIKAWATVWRQPPQRNEHLSVVNVFRFRWEADEVAERSQYCTVRRVTITWEQPNSSPKKKVRP